MPHDYLECLTSRPDSAEVKTDFYVDKMDEFITQFTTAQLVHNNIPRYTVEPIKPVKLVKPVE